MRNEEISEVHVCSDCDAKVELITGNCDEDRTEMRETRVNKRWNAKRRDEKYRESKS